MPQIRIIIGGGHPDKYLPMKKGAENFMMKVLAVCEDTALVMFATDLYDDPKWLGYHTDNHRATTLLELHEGERLDVTFPRGHWTYTGYKNLDDKISVEIGDVKKGNSVAVRPTFKDHFGEQNALEVIMHPAEGEEGEDLTYLYSNESMTSPSYEDYLYNRMPTAMREVAGEVGAERYPFEPNKILLRRNGETIAKLDGLNPIYREGRMEYRFIPYYTISEDFKTITIREVTADSESRFIKETVVIVDEDFESPYADRLASWCFKAGASIQEQAKRYSDLIEHFMLRAIDLGE